MKKLLLIFLCNFSIITYSKNQELLEHSRTTYQPVPNTQDIIPASSYVIDEILVIIYGPERTRVITKRELERLALDGRQRSLDDLITEELLFQEGLKFKIQIDDEAVDRFIANIRKQYNCTLEDVKLIFKQAGYTYEEGREQLRMMNMTQAVLENVIMIRLHVPREEVVAYYEQHPVLEESNYTLQMSFIPFDSAAPADVQREALIGNIKEGKTEKLIWYDPCVYKCSDIAQEMNFIKTMKIGDISAPIQTLRGFEVYRLVAHVPERPVPLEQRYKEIEHLLRQPQFEKKFQEHKKELYEFATMVYYTPVQQSRVI